MIRFDEVKRGAIAMVALATLSACSDGTNNVLVPQAEYDFSAVDTSFQEFLDDTTFDGISYTLVDVNQGAVHEGAQGDHTLDTVVQLASTSKMPSVSLLMALHDDASLDFDVEASIDNYLPWMGVHGDRTTVQLVSNTSGIPGLEGIPGYGPHICQFLGNSNLNDCGEMLYTVGVPGTVPAGTRFSYGGSQWQLAGAVAENIGNSTWNQLFDAYIGEPCDLDVFTYGNMWSNMGDWNGSPDSLTGQDNAHIEGGAITNMQDYAKILLMHLRGGRCGDTQVLSQESVQFMQVDRTSALGGPAYGMGWWVNAADMENNEVVYDPGAFGAISWLDMERGIGGYVGVDDYDGEESSAVYGHVLGVVIPMQQAIVDEARLAAGIE
jgi:CubicO group peptidase (beta-lactamase class C family)